jgi:hypothetical protein
MRLQRKQMEPAREARRRELSTVSECDSIPDHIPVCKRNPSDPRGDIPFLRRRAATCAHASPLHYPRTAVFAVSTSTSLNGVDGHGKGRASARSYMRLPKRVRRGGGAARAAAAAAAV